MGFFKKPVLSGKRRKALDTFRKNAVKALNELSKAANDDLSKQIYAGMVWNVQNTPIYFYPRKSLRERIFSARGRVFGSVVKGEHVNTVKIFQRGNQLAVVKSDFINLPAEHIFDGNKLTIDGIFTLSHEYAHFDKPAIGAFAAANGMSGSQAEELMADVLAAKLAVKMGYPKGHVLEHFEGRGIVYGSIPFKKFIKDAVK